MSAKFQLSVSSRARLAFLDKHVTHFGPPGQNFSGFGFVPSVLVDPLCMPTFQPSTSTRTGLV
jgi:hypothetical protein